MAKTGDYERVCRQCGHRWFIPKAIADERATSRGQMGRARVGLAVTNVFGQSKKRAELALMAGQQSRVAEANRCPACGSSDFVQADPSAPSPAAWHPDPTGRRQQRYWDGARWTEHVSDDGVQTTDPI
jgi:DNA-directed RNA polymerase subunit RPC12/RpoP